MINLDKNENYNSLEDWLETKRVYYGTKTGLQLYGGIVDFDPDKQKDLVGGEKITYDEYLDLQMEACEKEGKVRCNFAKCYHYIPLELQERQFALNVFTFLECIMMELVSREKKIMFGLINTDLNIIQLEIAYRFVLNRIATLKQEMENRLILGFVIWKT